jgi:hypothetical protein
VLNPSFEQMDSCSTNTIRLDVATNWDNICTDITCTPILSDICNGTVPFYFWGGGLSYQWPRTGNGMAYMHNFPPPPLILYIGM